MLCSIRRLQLPALHFVVNVRRHTHRHHFRVPSKGWDTGIRVYNCTAREQVPLILPNGGCVTWYTCGPTVYDATHLGHASCYVKLDIIQRILRQHFNVNLVTAMNITDIDDKIIQKSRETGKDWREVAQGHEANFWSDLSKLNVAEPNFKVRVTEHIPQIVAFIEQIIGKGIAYVAKDGSVYFEVNKYLNYGKLQKLNFTAEEEISSVTKEEGKMAAADFALWKAKKRTDEPAWDSPWGVGRPGWHIECSVLASMIFGQHVDFHAGGLDLKFPHHENEEAQSCVYHNINQWVNYWLHTGHLKVKNHAEKMSKSLKNTISIDEMLAKYTADDFRMACVLSNYRNAVEYSDELMQTSKNTLNRFKSFSTDCAAYLSGKKPGGHVHASNILQQLNNAKMKIDASLKDDFDTARCIAVLMEQITEVSRSINAPANIMVPPLMTANCLDVVAAIQNFVAQHLSMFGFAYAAAEHMPSTTRESKSEQIDINGLLDDLLRTRKIIRDRAVVENNKDLFKICDELRNCLRLHGIEIKDHRQGSSWEYNSDSK